MKKLSLHTFRLLFCLAAFTLNQRLGLLHVLTVDRNDKKFCQCEKHPEGAPTWSPKRSGVGSNLNITQNNNYSNRTQITGG